MPRIMLAVHRQWYGPILEDAVVEELGKLCELVRADDLGWMPIDDANEVARAEAEYAERIARERAEIVVTCWGTPKLTAGGFAKNPQLKYLVHVAGAVRDIVDRECIERGLVVSNWGNAIARTIAEASLMMILCALRRVAALQFHMHERGGWKPLPGMRPRSLFERRIGLHGLGGIARELVKLLEPFGCRIEAYSPHAPDDTFERLGVHRQPSLQRLYSTNDVISVHAAKTPETHHMVTGGILAGMKDGAVLVNTARGSVIDTDALVAELKAGRIAAALDVFEKEPLPKESPLRGLENCMLVPHEAGPTDDRKVDMGRLALANVKRYLAGKTPEHVVTLERYDLST